MREIIEIILELAVCVAIIFCLFTGNLTTEQLIAMGLSLILICGAVNEIREHFSRKRREEETGRKDGPAA